MDADENETCTKNVILPTSLTHLVFVQPAHLSRISPSLPARKLQVKPVPSK